jgi:hypothetical protein
MGASPIDAFRRPSFYTASAAVFSAQLMQTPARSIPQPVQLQLDL